MYNYTVNEIRYDTFQNQIDYTIPSVFLAGPTVRGHQRHLTSWRFEAIEEFKKQQFTGNLIIPEFPDNTESDQYRYDIPQWEFEGLKKSHCIMFWIPRDKELIGLTTNFELGYWMARNRDKIIYGRPKNAYRMSYCDIMWVEDFKDRYKLNHGVAIHTTLKKTVEVSMKKSINICKGICHA